MGINQIIDELSALKSNIAEISEKVENQLRADILDNDDNKILTVFVSRYMENRNLRNKMISQDLFSDPCWDILMDVFSARLNDKNISVSAVATAGNMPHTTGLRYIDTLEKIGYIYRERDDWDGRRIFVKMSDDTFRMMKEYFLRVLQKSQEYRYS
jgi:predicted transcriptional regulator